MFHPIKSLTESLNQSLNQLHEFSDPRCRAPLTAWSLELVAGAGAALAAPRVLMDQRLDQRPLHGVGGGGKHALCKLQADTEYTMQLTAHNSVGGSDPVTFSYSTAVAEPPVQMEAPTLKDSCWNWLDVEWKTPTVTLLIIYFID